MSEIIYDPVSQAVYNPSGSLKKPTDLQWVDVVNMALLRLNLGPLTNLQYDNSKTAVNARSHLTYAISEVLQVNDWRSATKTATLQRTLNQPIFLSGKGVSFDLPDDFIRLVGVKTQAYGIDLKWSRQGHTIVVEEPDASFCDIEYVYFPEGPGSLDPLIVTAISALLASKMAFNLTADNNLTQLLTQEFAVALANARVHDSQGIPDEMYSTNDWKRGY